MSRAVDWSAIASAVAVVGFAISGVVYFMSDQNRQDHDHLGSTDEAEIKAEIVEAKQDAVQAEKAAAIAEKNRINWRLSEYRRAEREGRLTDGGRARQEMLQTDNAELLLKAEALKNKEEALQREKELYEKLKMEK